MADFQFCAVSDIISDYCYLSSPVFVVCWLRAERKRKRNWQRRSDRKKRGGRRGRRAVGGGRRGAGRRRRIQEDVRLQPAPPDHQQEAGGAIRPEKLQSSFRSSSFSKTLDTNVIYMQNYWDWCGDTCTCSRSMSSAVLIPALVLMQP